MIKKIFSLFAAILFAGSMMAGTMSVDFESAASAYTDWTITTITTQQTNSEVSAHGGSYFGSTDGKASGSIVTKEKVNPSSITFYYSKLSTNSKEAWWRVKVSSDKSSWTTVESKAAGNGVTKGTWYEFTADLSSYSDVYVGVFYEGNTAARCLDDLVLTTAGGSSDPVAVTGVTLDKTEAEITVGGTVTLTPTVAPSNATNKAVTWESDDEDVATVVAGVVTGVAEGTATITVKTVDGNKTATCEVTVTAAPVDDADVVLDFSQDWGFPTSSGTKKVDEESFTDGTYTIKVAGSSGNGYYVSNSTYLLLGKNGAYVILPEFSSPIEKIVCEAGASTASTGVKWNVYDGDVAVSTEATGCTTDNTFEISEPAANKAYKIKVVSNHNLQIAKIKIYFGEPSADPSISASNIAIGTSWLKNGETIVKELTVTGANLTEGITVESSNTTKVEVSTTSLSAEGGKINVTIKAVAGELNETITLTSGSTSKVVTVTGTIMEIKQCEVAEAILYADQEDIKENDVIEVRGIVTKIQLKGKSFDQYGSACFYVADVNGGEGEFEFYNCYGYGKVKFNATTPAYDKESTEYADFTSVTDENGLTFSEGDEVIARGEYKYYSGTYELNTGCYLVYAKASGASWPTSVDNTDATNKAVKFIKNGQLFIEMNGRIYNVQGQTVK